MSYTEEDKWLSLLEKNNHLKRLFIEFDLELDFSKRPPITTKRERNENCKRNR